MNLGILGQSSLFGNSQKRNCNISLKEALSNINKNLPAWREKLERSRNQLQLAQADQTAHQKKVQELIETNQRLIEDSLEYFHASLKEFEKLAHPGTETPTTPTESKSNS